MKKKSLLLAALLLCAANSYSQLKVTKITDKNKDHYIANVIGYPIAGLYTTVDQAESNPALKKPTTLLNLDGTGTMQNEDLVKENIIWGIECSQSGVPIFKEGFNSATYSFWYKKAGKAKSDDENAWNLQSFSIHYDKKKMFISGERVKEYIE